MPESSARAEQWLTVHIQTYLLLCYDLCKNKITKIFNVSSVMMNGYYLAFSESGDSVLSPAPREPSRPAQGRMGSIGRIGHIGPMGPEECGR